MRVEPTSRQLSMGVSRGGRTYFAASLLLSIGSELIRPNCALWAVVEGTGNGSSQIARKVRMSSVRPWCVLGLTTDVACHEHVRGVRHLLGRGPFQAAALDRETVSFALRITMKL